MTSGHRRHGQNRDEIFDLPVRRNEGTRGKNNHANDTDQSECHTPFELGKDLGDLDKEIRKLGFLRSSTPCHVDFEHVSEQGRRNVQRKASQEDAKHESPLEIKND